MGVDLLTEGQGDPPGHGLQVRGATRGRSHCGISRWTGVVHRDPDQMGEELMRAVDDPVTTGVQLRWSEVR